MNKKIEGGTGNGRWNCTLSRSFSIAGNGVRGQESESNCNRALDHERIYTQHWACLFTHCVSSAAHSFSVVLVQLTGDESAVSI